MLSFVAPSPPTANGKAAASTSKALLFDVAEQEALHLNPTCLEMYLPDDEFEELFGMRKEAFYELKQWKQRELKKTYKLF